MGIQSIIQSAISPLEHYMLIKNRDQALEIQAHYGGSRRLINMKQIDKFPRSFQYGRVIFHKILHQNRLKYMDPQIAKVVANSYESEVNEYIIALHQEFGTTRASRAAKYFEEHWDFGFYLGPDIPPHLCIIYPLVSLCKEGFQRGCQYESNNQLVFQTAITTFGKPKNWNSPTFLQEQALAEYKKHKTLPSQFNQKALNPQFLVQLPCILDIKEQNNFEQLKKVYLDETILKFYESTFEKNDLWKQRQKLAQQIFYQNYIRRFKHKKQEYLQAYYKKNRDPIRRYYKEYREKKKIQIKKQRAYYYQNQKKNKEMSLSLHPDRQKLFEEVNEAYFKTLENEKYSDLDIRKLMKKNVDKLKYFESQVKTVEQVNQLEEEYLKQLSKVQRNPTLVDEFTQAEELDEFEKEQKVYDQQLIQKLKRMNITEDEENEEILFENFVEGDLKIKNMADEEVDDESAKHNWENYYYQLYKLNNKEIESDLEKEAKLKEELNEELFGEKFY